MSTNYQNIERDGMTKIIQLAKALCRILSAVKHILIGKYPDSEPIFALISAIEALCSLEQFYSADRISVKFAAKF